MTPCPVTEDRNGEAPRRLVAWERFTRTIPLSGGGITPLVSGIQRNSLPERRSEDLTHFWVQQRMGDCPTHGPTHPPCIHGGRVFCTLCVGMFARWSLPKTVRRRNTNVRQHTGAPTALSSMNFGGEHARVVRQRTWWLGWWHAVPQYPDNSCLQPDRLCSGGVCRAAESVDLDINFTMASKYRACASFAKEQCHDKANNA